MIKICTVYFGDRYSTDYVDKLYNSIKRNSTVDFEFIVISDTKVDSRLYDDSASQNRVTMFNKNITVLPYNHLGDIKKHWHKLKFFSPQFGNQKPGDDIIIMDIDQIITSNIDELLTWPVKDNELLTYGVWWENKLGINGGFYKFKSGSLKFVWDDFIKNPEFWQMNFYNKGDVHVPLYGEQNYVKWKIQEHNATLTKLPPEWLGTWTDSYKKNLELNQMYMNRFNTDYMIMDDVHENIKVVHFAGVGKTITGNDKFIKDNWK